MGKKYHILGRSGAGSLIAEFLLMESDVEYEITFVNLEKKDNRHIKSSHPQGKIPTLICPDGSRIFETLAITNHITDRYKCLVPVNGTALYDHYWQFLSLLATSIYPAYHRQHHSRAYVNEDAYEDLQKKARFEQATIYDYINRQLSPYICGDLLTAADFYLFMLMRWDLDKSSLFNKRDGLKKLWELVRQRPSVNTVLESQTPKPRSMK